MQELASLFTALGQRLLVRLHTFEPDAEDVDNWLARLIAWKEQQQRLFLRYAKVCHSPEPDKVRQFVTQMNFFDCSDPLIRIARSLRRGSLPLASQVEPALEAASGQSQYAQAIQRGYTHLQAVGKFFAGILDLTKLKLQLGLK